MKKETEIIFKSFFNEFSDRLELLLDTEKADKKSYEVVKLLLDYLDLKYSNKIRYLETSSRFSKIIPFLNISTNFDPILEDQVNQQLDVLTGSTGNGDPRRSIIETNRHDLRFRLSSIMHSISRYSKKVLPDDIKLATILDPFPNKDQDHLDFSVLPDGGMLMMICDGVSGDGPSSKDFAEALPSLVFEELKHNNGYYKNIQSWEQEVTQAVENSIQKMPLDSGSSTMILAYLHQNRKDLYLSWLGDGNIILFNSDKTGFGKLLIPHQSESGQLTSVATSNGLIGKLSSYTVRTNGGILILSSDGFNLTNGRLLKHFYQQVLKSEDLQTNLENWTHGECCGEQSMHPEALDDRSMIVLNWNV